MMTDNGKSEPTPVEDVARTAKDNAVQRDQQLVEEWKQLASDATSADEVSKLSKRHSDLLAEAEGVHREFAKACVRRAVAYGWVRVSEEQGVSAKQIHAWHKQYLPELPDLSRVPEREMRREERRIADLERRLQSEKQLRAKFNAAQKRYNELKNGVEQ